MKLTISDKKEEKLFSRVVVSGRLIFEGPTPSTKDVSEAFAKESGKDASLVVVKEIYTDFGMQEASVLAFVYDSAEKLKAVEAVKVKAKDGEEKPAEAAPAEVPKEEKPAEEAPKEEKKEEAPKE